MKNRALYSALGWLGLSIVAFAAIVGGIVFTMSSVFVKTERDDGIV